MADAWHPETGEYLTSIDRGALPADWVIIGKGAAVTLDDLPVCDRRYWKRSGDTIVEMTDAEKGALDLPAAKQAKAAAIESWYAAVLADGYDTGLGYCLAATADDQTRFTQDAVLQSQAVAMQLAAVNDPIAFLDLTGVPRMATIGDYLAMLVDYGQWCRAKLIARAGLLLAANTATTVAELNAIAVPPQ